MSKDYISIEDTEAMPPCRGIIGTLFGHKFEPRYDEHDEVYKGMDSSYGHYVLDICVRCGFVVRRVTDRSAEVTDRMFEEPAPPWPALPAQVATPMPAPTPAPAPTPVQATKPRIVLAQPQQAQQLMNVPPGAQGSAVKAVPGRGPK